MVFQILIQSYLWIGFLLMVWMVIDCVLYEDDRLIWLIVILFLWGLGPIVYFFARFLPRKQNNVFHKIGRQFNNRELKRLEFSAHQIGNSYHWLQYADKLREYRRIDQAEAAYRKALEREHDNPQAMWGLAWCLERRERYDEALKWVEEILAVDPEYKFGDVSLAKGRLLVKQEQWARAKEHLSQHVHRWRQAEGLYHLALCQKHEGQPHEAKENLRALLMDLEASPPAIARKQSAWKRKAKSLLKDL